MMTRRDFSMQGMLMPGSLGSGPGIVLSPAHRQAVNRRRRIAVQFDAYDHSAA